MISQVENALYRAILIRRYVNFESPRQIAKEMGYAERWLRTLNGQALDEVARLLGLADE